MEKQEQNQEWKKVGYFGSGEIFVRGDEGKIVSPGMKDFNYRIKPQLRQQIEPSSPPSEVVKTNL